MEQYRKSPRAKFLDYDSGVYFVTICTEGKKHYFGEIKNSEMRFSAIGQFADNQLRRCTEFCPSLKISLYVVMPNHMHFIISLPEKRKTVGFEQRTPNPALRTNPSNHRHVPALSKYVSSLKSSVTKYARSLGLDFGWQERYNDHQIRGRQDEVLLVNTSSTMLHSGNKIAFINYEITIAIVDQTSSQNTFPANTFPPW